MDFQRKERRPLRPSVEWRTAGRAGWTRPVIFVSWNDAHSYLRWLVGETGKPYRLLSEAEWEYAARAGDKAHFWGDEINGKANCGGCGQRESKTTLVGSFEANKFGLHDMLGNVFEWVEDCYDLSYDGAPEDGSARISDDCETHVLRGGTWEHPKEWLHAAHRHHDFPYSRTKHLGFRVARDLGSNSRTP
jgi:formylglycine-generating enzyme required for sulfatase activity